MRLTLLAAVFFCWALAFSAHAQRVACEAIDLAGNTTRLVDISLAENWEIKGERIGEPPAAGPATVSIKGTDLSSLLFTGRNGTRSRLPAIIFPTGEVLFGDIISTDADNLKLKSKFVGEVSVPLAKISSIVLDPDAFDWTQKNPRKERNQEGDAIRLNNGDEFVGSLLSLTGEKVNANRDGKEVSLDRALVASVRFDPSLVDYTLDGSLYAVVDLTDESQLFVQNLVTSGEKWVGTTKAGIAVKIDPKEIVTLSFRNGRLIYLSDMKPLAEKAEGYLDNALPARKDQSVLGQPIRLAGRLYRKGLGVKSMTTLEYDVAGYARFDASVGLDESAGSLSSVRVLVQVDEKTVFDSQEMLPGQPAVNVSVELSNAKKLTLVVDPMKRADIQDFVDWADARLLR